jgi:hypothetical protein
MVAYNLDSPGDEQEYIAAIRAYAVEQFSVSLEAGGVAHLESGKKRAEAEVNRWLDRFSRSRRYPAPATAARVRAARELFLDVFADDWDRRVDVVSNTG